MRFVPVSTQLNAKKLYATAHSSPNSTLGPCINRFFNGGIDGITFLCNDRNEFKASVICNVLIYSHMDDSHGIFMKILEILHVVDYN